MGTALLVGVLVVAAAAGGWWLQRSRSGRRGPPGDPPRLRGPAGGWHRTKGPAGMAVLALIALLILFLVTQQFGSGPPATPAAPGTLVVRIATFVVDNGDQATGPKVADELLDALTHSPRLTTPMNFGRLTGDIATPAAALAAAQRSGANVVIWGTVRSGARAGDPALRPRLTWLPPATWTPASWVGSERWSFPIHYDLARVPVNGSAVLPDLLDSLALVQVGTIEAAGPKLATLRRDYGNVLRDELPAELVGFLWWAEGINGEAETALRAAVAAEPRSEHWNNLGVVLLDAGRTAEALAAWNQALELTPTVAQAYTNRGRLLLATKGPNEALPNLETGSAGGDATALPYLALARRRNGQLALGRVAARTALAHDPTNSIALTERAVLALTDVATATGRLEWELESPSVRSIGQLGELRGQLQGVLDRLTALRTAALRAATAAGAAGKPNLQRLHETQARRLQAEQAPIHYAMMLTMIEQGRVLAQHPPGSFTRFWDWIRGKQTPLQEAAALVTSAETTVPQLKYDLGYQLGRARWLSGDTPAAIAAWDAAAALTNTATLARQPEVPFGVGRLQEAAGRPATARVLFAQAVTIAPNYQPARQALLKLDRQESRWADAETQLRWFVAQQPSVEFELQLAEVLAQQARRADAEAILLPLANGGNSAAMTALGALYRKAGRWDAATTVLERAIAANPQDAAAYEEQAAVVLARPAADAAALGAREAIAAATLRKSILADPNRQSAHLALAESLVRQGQPAAAAQEFQAAVAINSSDPLVYRQLGEVLLASGQPGPAADSFRRALVLAPNSHEAHHGLAMAYFAQGRLAEAQTEEEKTLALANNNYTLALVGLGDIARAKNQIAVAVQHYTAALAQDPKIAGGFAGLGESALQQNAPEVAVKHFQDGLAANPHNVPLLLGLGRAQLRSGDPRAAEQSFRLVQTLNAGIAAAYAGAGQALWKQGQSAAAVGQFREAVQRSPGDADSWLALGEINATTNQLQAALDSYGRAATARPTWDMPHYRRGVLLLENNQPAAAVNDLQTAVRLNDAFPQGHYWLGRAFRANSDPGNAERQLRRAVELDPNYQEARLFLGRVLAERGKIAEARTTYQTLIDGTGGDNQWHTEAVQDIARITGP